MKFEVFICEGNFMPIWMFEWLFGKCLLLCYGENTVVGSNFKCGSFFALVNFCPNDNDLHTMQNITCVLISMAVNTTHSMQIKVICYYPCRVGIYYIVFHLTLNVISFIFDHKLFWQFVMLNQVTTKINIYF